MINKVSGSQYTFLSKELGRILEVAKSSQMSFLKLKQPVVLTRSNAIFLMS